MVSGGADGVRTEGGGVGAGAEDVPAFFVGHDAAHGQTAGDALGKGRHIRQDAVILKGEQLAGAATPVCTSSTSSSQSRSSQSFLTACTYS